MAIWNRQEVRDSLADLGCEIVDTHPGGDWDIPGLRALPENTENWISITPFHSPYSNPSENPTDKCEVYAIELRTNGDSRGGLQSDEEHVCVAFAKIQARLTAAGHNIIPHYDSIF